jgi:DcuC family C4-dicarboxylate transporter
VQEAFNSRLIGVAMLIGGVVAACTDRKAGLRAAAAFFDGAGYALTHIVSLIVAAACFGEGVKQIGLDAVVAGLLRLAPGLLIPAAGFLSLGFGFISGSGIAATQSLYHFFAAPAVTLGVAPDFVGAVVSLGAAAGRTMSPVAAVALMSGSLTETPPTELVRRVAGPICLGMTAVVVVASLMVTSGMVKSPSKPPAMPAGASRP